MAKQFGDMVLKNFLAPAEVLLFCKRRRDQASKALKEFPDLVKQKRDKEVAFEYDINDGAPVPEFGGDEGTDGKQDLGEWEDPELSDTDHLDEDKTDQSTVKAEHPKQRPVQDPGKLYLADNESDNESDGLAYSEEYSYWYGDGVCG